MPQAPRSPDDAHSAVPLRPPEDAQPLPQAPRSPDDAHPAASLRPPEDAQPLPQARRSPDDAHSAAPLRPPAVAHSAAPSRAPAVAQPSARALHPDRESRSANHRRGRTAYYPRSSFRIVHSTLLSLPIHRSRSLTGSAGLRNRDLRKSCGLRPRRLPGPPRRRAIQCNPDTSGQTAPASPSAAQSRARLQVY